MKARRRDPGLWAKSHQATPADEYRQERLPLMPAGEMGGRRLLPGLEIARPYNAKETPLLATWTDQQPKNWQPHTYDPDEARNCRYCGEAGRCHGTRAELANAREAGYLASEYGECGDLVNE